MVPIDVSLKLTVSGRTPLVGLPVKLAAGTTAPAPLIRLLLLPAVVVKTTVLVKLPVLVGANRTTMLLEPKPGTLKSVPDTMLKPKPVTEALPLVMGAPPRLFTTKLT